MKIQLSLEFAQGWPGFYQRNRTGSLCSSLLALLTAQWEVWGERGVSNCASVLFSGSILSRSIMAFLAISILKKEPANIKEKCWFCLSAIQNILVAEDNFCWIVSAPKFQGHFRVWQVTSIASLPFRTELGFFVSWLFGIQEDNNLYKALVRIRA